MIDLNILIQCAGASEGLNKCSVRDISPGPREVQTHEIMHQLYLDEPGLFVSDCILGSVHKVDLLIYLSGVLLAGEGLRSLCWNS